MFCGHFFHKKSTNELYFLDTSRGRLIWDNDLNEPTVLFGSSKIELYKIKNNKLISFAELPNSVQAQNFIIRNDMLYVYTDGYGVIAQFDINGNYISYLQKPVNDNFFDGKITEFGNSFFLMKSIRNKQNKLFIVKEK